jgi:rubrerythrin
MTLRTGIWVETLAVKHYGELLKDIDWDDDTRAVVERNWNNEKGHVSRWKSLLSSP